MYLQTSRLQYNLQEIGVFQKSTLRKSRFRLQPVSLVYQLMADYATANFRDKWPKVGSGTDDILP